MSHTALNITLLIVTETVIWIGGWLYRHFQTTKLVSSAMVVRRTDVKVQCFALGILLLFIILCPMENLGRFPEKSRLRQSCVIIPPAVRPALFRQIGMGSFTCAHTCRTHEKGKGGGRVRHKQVSRLGRDIKKNLSVTLSGQEIEAGVFGFEFRSFNYH